MMKNKEIGGFFQLELALNNEYHKNAIKLNSGRNCLFYILKSRNYKKVYLPFYSCDALLEPISKLDISFEFYYINDKFKPDFKPKLNDDEVLLYINYFDLNIVNVHKVIEGYRNVIIDNTQSFFRMPLKNEDTFYSPRKFFGVADGGYLYTCNETNEFFQQDVSYKRYQHLLKRLDLSAQESYSIYKENEESLSDNDIKKMSNLTQKILQSIDYGKVISIRNENFMFLHDHLSKYNKISIDTKELHGAMVYPFLFYKEGLREYLINNNIYNATYWNEVLERVNKESFEYKLTKYLIPIPIDQRYGINDMNKILECIKSFIIKE